MGNNTTCSKMEQQQSTMTTRVASRLKKNPIFPSCENETYSNTLSVHKRKEKKC